MFADRRGKSSPEPLPVVEETHEPMQRRRQVAQGHCEEVFEETALELMQAAAWSSEHRALEADLRSDLAQVLVPFATTEVGLPLGAIRQEGSGRSGRFDSMIGSAIIEYKAPRLLRLHPQRAQAATQALEYLADERLGARAVIVTDGETWGILRDIGASPDIGDQATLDLGAQAEGLIPPIARFAWRANSVSTARAVLDLIASQRSTPVTSHAVISFLGPSREECLALLAALAKALASRSPSSRTDVLFNQWIRTAGISYGISDPDVPWPTRGTPESILPPGLRDALAGRSFAETVYVLHTYIAIAAKLIAAEVLAIQRQQSDLRPTQWPHFEEKELLRLVRDLESGVLSDQLGAPGLLASDLFDWYSHDAHEHPALIAALRRFMRQLSLLAWAQIATAGGMQIDLLRDLYQAVVPPALRKSLGEFFTPQWLAEYVFARALQIHETRPDASTRASVIPRTLDPSCGSGTFLVAAARTGLQRLDRQELGSDPAALKSLVDSIIGIDINSVSALMARVNLLLVLGDRILALPEITFHVFQADSIILPRAVTEQLDLATAGDFVRISTSVGDFRLPTILLTASRMAILRRNLESSLRSRSSDQLYVQILRAQLAAEGSVSYTEFEKVSDTALALYQQLCQLRDDDRDDVWARVLEQLVSPYLLDHVEIVVGNPPWVSWKDLPAAWKSRSEPIWKAWGLWRSTGRQGTPLSDVSTLLLARSIVTYAPAGLVAMLLPQSVLLADPGGNAFRRSWLRPETHDRTDRGDDISIPFRVRAIDDFVAINPFSPDASNQTVALFIEPGATPVFPIATRVWKRRARQRMKAEWSWSRVEQILSVENHKSSPVDPGNLESPWGLVGAVDGLALRREGEAAPYSFGRGFETRGLDGLFLFTVITASPTGATMQIRVRNLPEAGRNTAGAIPREGVVEAEYFWPLVKGEDVQRWVVRDTDRFIFVPYVLSNARVEKLTVDKCATSAPRTLQYLLPWIERYAGRSMYRGGLDEQFPWELSGPTDHLKSEGALLFVRYLATGGRPAAAVREASFYPRLGRTTLPLPNNKSNIYYTKSVAEAHYIAAFINSGPAQDALGRFAVSTGVTPAALARLPISRFSPLDPLHAALAQAGKDAADLALRGETDKLIEVEQAIASLVISLCAGRESSALDSVDN